jgi:glycerophosphoryl diester phosphodiesterase
VRKIHLAAALLAATLVTVPGGAANARTLCAELEIQAHRGYHYGRIDQNTVRSFDEANARGYTIETDVWADAQGQLWIYHDRDVSKLSTGTGFIDQMTTTQVAALRYKKAGSPLPKFEEAVAAWTAYPNHQRIYIEPKQQSTIASMARQLQAAGLDDNTWFVGYWDFVVRNQREGNFSPDFNTMPKSSTYYEPSRWAGHEALMTGVASMTTDRVAAYDDAGLEVQHFRNNTTTAWERAIRLNFDAIMTDRPNELKAFCPTVQ